MARYSKPFTEPTNKPSSKSKHGSINSSDELAPKTTKSLFHRQKKTKCAVCKKTDTIAKPYVATTGSVHPKCHDEVMAKRKEDEEKKGNAEDTTEEQAKRLDYPQCIICKKYADKGDKIYVYSDSEIIDGKDQGSVHRSCFEQLRKVQTDERMEETSC